MRLWQALSYFFIEASKRLWRAWGASLVATLAIAISLFLVGFFLLVGHNLERLTQTWSGEAKVVVYLAPAAGPEATRELVARLRGAGWVAALTEVDAAEAGRRFREMFPSLADLVLEDQPFPRSLELELRPGAQPDSALEALATDPAVQLIDDDRDLVRQLRSVTWVVRVVGLGLIGVLLLAALFTIGSVIRLKAYLDQDEISILRLVGSTEFFIRGPFLAEGVLQGGLGGAVALGALAATAYGLHQRFVELPLAQALFERFLPWPQALGLVGLGALAGLVGTVASLRRERLAPAPEE